MSFLEVSNLSLYGKLNFGAAILGPEFDASEIESITSAAKSFGFSIASDDSQFIVGAYSSAKAFIYKHNGTTWEKALELTKSGRFGYKVAISGDWAAVTNTPTSGNGTVFMYRRVGGVWQSTEFTTILVPVSTAGSGFAASVSLHNGTLVVGHTKANTVGGVHVYVWNGTSWEQQGSLLSIPSNESRAGTNQNLGTEVSVHGDILVAGGSGDTLGRGAGVAFVSKRTTGTWSTPSPIKPATTYNDGFGWSVVCRGTTVVVGAPYGNSTEQHPGRAFVYSCAGETPVLEKIITVKTDRSEIIQDTLVTTADNFGWALSLNDAATVLAVGAINRYGARGIVYVFEKLNNEWKKSALSNSWLTASDAAVNNRFGSAVAFIQDGLVVGAYSKGAIYWFK